MRSRSLPNPALAPVTALLCDTSIKLIIPHWGSLLLVPFPHWGAFSSPKGGLNGKTRPQNKKTLSSSHLLHFKGARLCKLPRSLWSRNMGRRSAPACTFFPNLQDQSETLVPNKQKTLSVGTQGAPAAPQSRLWGCRSQHTYWCRSFLQDRRSRHVAEQGAGDGVPSAMASSVCHSSGSASLHPSLTKSWSSSHPPW